MHIRLSLFFFLNSSILEKKDLFCGVISLDSLHVHCIRRRIRNDDYKILLSCSSGIRETVENLKTIRIMRTRGIRYSHFELFGCFEGKPIITDCHVSRLHNSMDRRTGHTCWKHTSSSLCLGIPRVPHRSRIPGQERGRERERWTNYIRPVTAKN